ncbi:MAG: S8 family serine peptidase [Opitutaceae bacterium]
MKGSVTAIAHGTSQPGLPGVVEGAVPSGTSGGRDAVRTPATGLAALLDGAEAIASEETASGTEGVVKRTRIVKTSHFKYPMLRIEETVRPAAGTEPEQVLSQKAVVADHIVVKMNPEATEAELKALVAGYGGKIRKKMYTPGVYLVELKECTIPELPAALAVFNDKKATVAYAAPDGIAYALETVPNDPEFPRLWGMRNTGQNSGVAGADIKATSAWDISTGSQDIVVGVIDTGVDYTHPDLAANIWVNPGETGFDAQGRDKATNGIDDDGNGFVDDVHGYDFANDDGDPMDDHYHGTHCAGTIGGVGNNGAGVAGVNWTVKIAAGKFLSGTGSGTNSDGADAIHYMTVIGVRLTSNSWGGGPWDGTMDPELQLLQDAIAEAGRANILFVAAAANSATSKYFIPAAFTNANILSVAATDNKDALAVFSNYGADWVDIGAPGVGIVSCDSGGGYRSLSGTSMATPHVAGAAALLLSIAPQMSCDAVKTILMNTSDPLPSLDGLTVTGARLNVYRALQAVTTPTVIIKDTVIQDNNLNGTIGNSDGMASPGERVGLKVTLRNPSPFAAVGVTAQLSLVSPDPYVTLLSANASYGDIAAKSDVLSGDLFLLNIAPATPVSHTVAMRLTVQDTGGHSWTSAVEVTVRNLISITGTVRLNGVGLAGAKVYVGGALNTTATTLSDGTYVAGALAGPCGVWAETGVAGDLKTAVQTMNLNGNTTGVDFAFTTATISGNVRDGVTQAAVGNARIEYKGLVSGTVLTDASGNYSITKAYGQPATLTLVANKPGAYWASPPTTVTVPPDATGIDFLLSSPDIAITPAQFNVSAVFPAVTTDVLTITNRGGVPLTWRIWNETDESFSLSGIGSGAGTVVRNLYFMDRPDTVFGNPSGIAFDGEGIWVNGIGGYGGSMLTKMDPVDGHFLKRIDVVNIAPKGQGLAWSGGHLWMAGGNTKKIHALDPNTGDEIRSIAMPADGGDPTGVGFGGGAMWVLTGKLEPLGGWVCSIYKMNPDDGTVLAKFPVPAEIMPVPSMIVRGLTYYNGALWVVSCRSGNATNAAGPGEVAKVYKLSPIDGTVLGSFNPPAFSIGGSDRTLHYRGLTADNDGNLWLVNLYNKAYLVNAGEKMWLRSSAHAGVVPPFSSTNVTLTFDSAASGPGTFHGRVAVASDDPDQPLISPPVTFTVTTPLAISGHVTLNGGALAGATIEYKGPFSGSVLSDGSGAYSIPARAGTYTLTARKDDYLATATTSVTVASSNVSNVNFAFTSVTISGTVRDGLTQAPVGNATIEYSGALSGTVLTAADGTYSITRTYGRATTLSLTAKKEGTYFASDARSVGLSSSVSGVDFQVGIPDIEVAPGSFDVTASFPDSIHQTLSITNRGAATLNWQIRNSVDWSSGSRPLGGGTTNRQVVVPSSIGAPRGIATDGTRLWTTGYDAMADGAVLYELSLADGHIVSTLDIAGLCGTYAVAGTGIEWDGSLLWFIGSGLKRIYAIDPFNQTLVKTFDVPDNNNVPSIVTAGEGFLWIHSSVQLTAWKSASVIYKVSPDDGMVRDLLTLSTNDVPHVYGMAYHNGALWVTGDNGLIQKLDPADGRVISSFQGPANGKDLAGGGTSGLWVLNNDGTTLRASLLNPGGDRPWLSTASEAGTIPAFGSTTVDVLLDSAAVGPGVHQGNLLVMSNDLDQPLVTVPTTFRVTTPCTISGTVRMDGQARPGAVIEYSGPYMGSLQSGADGTYVLQAAAGVYTLTAKIADAVDSAPTSITVVASSVPNVDFTFTTATIQGTVRDAATRVAVGNATIEYSGALSGSVTTAVNGSYAITRVYGRPVTLTLTAKMPEVYGDSAPRDVPVPPSQANVNFLMGTATIGVSPASFTLDAIYPEVLTRTLAITSQSGAALNWRTWNELLAPPQTQIAGSGGGTLLRQFDLVGADVGDTMGVAFDGRLLWVTDRTRTIKKFDPVTGELVGSLLTAGAGSQLHGIAWEGANLWVGSTISGYHYVYRVDRVTGSVLQTISLPVTYSTGRSPFITFGEGALWVMGTDSFTGKSALYKVNPVNGSLLAKINLAASVLNTWGLAYFNGALWTASNQGTEAGRVYKLNPVTGAVLRSFMAAGPPVLPYGFCSDTEGALWTVSYYKRAYLIDAGETTWLRMEPHPLFGTVPGLSSMNATVAFDSSNAGPGIHTANLHVVSNDAETPDLPLPVTFRVHKPVAQFTGLPATGTAPLLVNLNASASSDLPGETFTYEWTFGDGSVANGMQVSHTYLTGGTFTVTLKITDGIGATGSASRTIVVAPGPPPPEDSDGNGLPDAWENLWFNQIGVNPNADADGDGYSNLQEYVMGTNPKDPNSVLRVQLIPQGEGLAIVRFQRHSASGTGYAGKTRTYRLEAATTLAPATWATLPGYEAIPALDATVDCPVEITARSSFFRVRVILQ